MKRLSYSLISILVMVGWLLTGVTPIAAAGGTGGGRVDPYYGSFSTEIPLVVPQYHGLEPALKLVYGSSGGNGFVGVGWGLSGVSVIERASAGGGAPRYDSSDTFYMDGMELLADTSMGGTHSTRIKNYTRIRWDGAANKWYVWGTNGDKATYESTYGTAGGTFRWMLKTIEDLHGNLITYNYWCEGGADCYLDNITYNGATVTFYRESRPDPLTFATGSGLGTTNYRLKSIAVRLSGNLARAYKLSYTTSGATQRSLLTSVQQFGKNATVDSSGNVSGGTSLPAMTMSYNATTLTFGGAESWPTGGYLAMGDGSKDEYRPAGVEYADFNGDGLQDVAWALYECNGWYNAGCEGHTEIKLRTATGYVNGPAWPTGGYLAMAIDTSSKIADGGVRLVDMNGDGKTDIVWSLYECNGWYGNSGCQAHNEIWLSTGSGFTAGPTWPTSGFISMARDTSQETYDGGVRLADVNGDGKTDVVWSLWEENGWYGGGPAAHNEIKLYSDSGFTNGPAWPTAGYLAMTVDSSQTTTDGGVRLADMNGDGKIDVLWSLWECTGWYTAGCEAHNEIKLSTGTGFVAGPAWPTAGYLAIGRGTSKEMMDGGVRLADINGDGKTDIVWSLYECNGWYNNSGCEVHNEIKLYTGGAFVNGPAWPTSGYLAMALSTTDIVRDGGVRLADINGDGRTDVIWSLWECTDDWYGAGCSGHNEIKLSTGTGFVAGPAWPTSGYLAMTGSRVPQLSGSATDNDLGICRIQGNGNTLTVYGAHEVYDDGWYCDEVVGTLNLKLATASGSAGVSYRAIFGVHGSGNTLDICDYDGENGEWCTGSLSLQDTSASGGATSAYNLRLCKVEGSGNQLIFYRRVNDDGWQYCGSEAGRITLASSTGVNYEVTDGGVRLRDLDGNGTTDLAWSLYECGDAYGAGCAAHNEERRSNGGADLLTSIKNGIGGTTSVTYKPSTAWANTAMPERLILQTVASLTTSDGRGNSNTVNYSYQGGLFSWTDKRFLGFRKVTAVVDPQGNYTETYYWQHVGSTAKPEITYYKDSAGNIFSYSSYEYTENNSTPYTSLLTRRWDYECNQTTTCRRTLIELAYDQYGNVVQTKEYGDYDLSGDERTTARGYYPNTSAYIVGFPAYENVYQGLGTSGTLLKQTLYIYDANTDYNQAPTKGEGTRTRTWNSKDGSYVEVKRTFDSYGNVTSVTDPLNHLNTTSYDANYHQYITQSCNALNQCASQAWDYVLGQVTAVTDANSIATTYTYDALGRLTQTSYNGGVVETNQYLNWGDPNTQKIRTSQADGSADGLWTEAYLDGLGRGYKVVREGGFIQETIYSGMSERVWKKSLPYFSGETVKWTVYTYDGAMRQRTATNPDGTYAEVVYAIDGNGKPYTAYYDELRNERVEWRDAYGQLTQIREKNGSSYYYTTYQYDINKNLVRVVDQNGNVTTATYNSLGNKLSMVDPDMGTWTYTYDANGNLTSQTDARNKTVTLTYDAIGRVKTRQTSDGTTTYYYDESGHGTATGQLTRKVYPGGNESYTYDARGRVTSSTLCVDTVCKTFGSSYDNLNRLTAQTYPDNEQVTYTYNSNGQLTAVSNYVSNILYNARGQVLAIGYTNGTTTTYTYNDNRAWLSTANVTKNGTTLYNASYIYDNAARITRMDSSTNPLENNLTYTYDGLNRLTGVSGGQSASWTYDAIGNITSGPLGTYTYGNAAHKHAVTAAGSRTYTYDANGNLLTGDGRTLTWNADNMPATVVKGGVTTSYTYNGGEGRIKKVSGSVTTRYFGLVEDENGTLVKYYYAGPILVAEQRGTTKSWYHADHLGSIRMLTDASGVKVRSYDYKPFGDTAGQSGSTANTRGYGGHIKDDESGLIYMGARYYDPALGRFISPDTIIPDTTNPQAFNRYSYVYNNPINNTDPSGHMPVVAAVVAVVGAIGAGGTILAVAVIGAVCTVAGYATKNPLLSSIGGILLGFSGGYAMPIGGSAFAGGLLGASVAGATSPISPLDPGLKQAVGWAYSAYGLIRSLSDSSGKSQQQDSTGGKLERYSPVRECMNDPSCTLLAEGEERVYGRFKIGYEESGPSATQGTFAPEIDNEGKITVIGGVSGHAAKRTGYAQYGGDAFGVRMEGSQTLGAFDSGGVVIEKGRLQLGTPSAGAYKASTSVNVNLGIVSGKVEVGATLNPGMPIPMPAATGSVGLTQPFANYLGNATRNLPNQIIKAVPAPVSRWITEPLRRR